MCSHPFHATRGMRGASPDGGRSDGADFPHAGHPSRRASARASAAGSSLRSLIRWADAYRPRRRRTGDRQDAPAQCGCRACSGGGCARLRGGGIRCRRNATLSAIPRSARAAHPLCLADTLRAQTGALATILATILPELAVHLGESPPAYPLPPEQARVRLYEAVGAFLAAIAAPNALVVILDDLHWADPASLDLLCYVARQQPTARLLDPRRVPCGRSGRSPRVRACISGTQPNADARYDRHRPTFGGGGCYVWRGDPRWAGGCNARATPRRTERGQSVLR